MRIIMWATAVVFVALIALLIIFKPAEKPVELNYDNAPLLGSADAPVKLAEFGDFKCPACQYFTLNVMPEIQEKYIDTGKVSLSFFNYTIISADSNTAALAAQSVYHQSNEEFWKYYEALYRNQPDESLAWATTDYLVDLAKSLELDIDYDKLRSDIENKTYQDEIDEQNKLARSEQFPGTPAVLVNGERLDDSVSLDPKKFLERIEKAVADAEKESAENA
ncbi:DsbA family protein [Cohnella thailandensis]|uniref:Thioredoxin domain-containing protein n=1 Tax=Cohnella thailandensis TaxID=557557 RepID=A0A841SZF1_9BACL|nr:thioredoxin domain-containing protein [Cohnella thailandensis]MBB6636249.1 thioredoxin domain-containing protein [Cohnella thailandensis]MBP1973782.1 protein-disulfide isomerase [Cohnella thailandensis]